MDSTVLRINTECKHVLQDTRLCMSNTFGRGSAVLFLTASGLSGSKCNHNTTIARPTRRLLQEQ
eukprot:4097001-Amphidinium_carterae.1